ncbi:type I-C CRISPR-associated protein Cas8c/Csd1 [Methylococcus sp. ANG]|uniref:type I-C CRISPR-associated protein Cas8c/Csd1 n=1 Tax=Methylococcus sp. ANG TaxID=3231903 RepID=UPI0034599579
MILQALHDYYQRKQRSDDPKDRLPAYGLEEKEIPFIIEIDGEGRFVNLADTRTGDGKKKTAQRFLVPQGVKKTSGVAANLLWDTAEYVLGVDTRGNPDRIVQQHSAFRSRLDELPESAQSDPGIVAVRNFLDRRDIAPLENHPAWNDVLATNPTLSFRLHGDVELICQRSAVAMVAVGTKNADGESPSGICLVTGAIAPIERLHPAIKGVKDKPGSPAQKNIVSFNCRAFESYGKTEQQGANAPVGKPAVFAYTTALNHLLSKGSRQRIQIGDASTVFWAEQPHDLETMAADLFGEPPKDQPDRGTDALKALYQSVESGNFAIGEADTRFHVLGLAPNAARISIRFWETAPAYELARRLKRHFDDIRIAKADYEAEHLSLFRLLTSVAVQGKADNIPPNLGGDIVRAILEDLPYPTTLLNAAVQRCRAEQKVTYPRAAALKAWLNRSIRRDNRNSSTPEKEFDVMLDPQNTDAAYRMGRLFAVLEKIQEEANPGINATIRDRYYGAASSAPATVFPLLLKLATHHIGKLDEKGRKMLYRAFSDNTPDNYIGQVLNQVDEIPRQLRLPEQGRFALGYYHQRQAFFAK